MHSEWRYSLVFTSVSSSRWCWSLDLVRMFSQPEREQKQNTEKNIWMSFNVPRNSVQCTLECKTSKIQTWRAVCDPETTHASIFVFYRKPLPTSFHTSFCSIASILGVTSHTRFRRSGQRASAQRNRQALTEHTAFSIVANELSWRWTLSWRSKCVWVTFFCVKKFGQPPSTRWPVNRNVKVGEYLPLVSVSKGLLSTSLFWGLEWRSH